MQEVWPIDFESHQLKGKNQLKLIYEKNMLSILHAVKQWRLYLMGRYFQVTIDHDSLKQFLEQRLSFKEEKNLVTKMLGYEFEIIYKKDKENIVAYVLSKKDENDEALFYVISIIQLDWVVGAKEEWKNDVSTSNLIQQLLI